jgi:hypothetical protein
MKKINNKRSYKQQYDYLWISKRIVFLLEKELLYIGEPVLKVNYCDEYYLSEFKREGEEFIQSLSETVMMQFINKLPTVPKDHISFIDYACYAVEKLIIHKLKLASNECISHFNIEYEKNMSNKI